MIEVIYDGKYPNTCRGTLTIKENGKVIYEKSYCCYSTGNVWFDDDWCENVESGELIWEDASKFSEEIQKAVQKELDKHEVCCGGCV